MKRIILFIALMTTMLSCVKEQEEEQPMSVNGTERVRASASDFVYGNESTKTLITQEGTNAPGFSWKEGDVIGIIPMNNETVQSNYKISEISSDPREAMFDGGVWALKEGKEYAAYYPFKKEALLSNESLEFSFLGQTQAANNSLAHLGAYDYMYASSIVPADGVATFQFKHLISLVRLQLTVPEADTYTRVVLESSDNWFASGASLKLSDGTMTAMETGKSATIDLNNIVITAGGVLTVWFAMLPTSALKDNTLSVNLYGQEVVYTEEITGITSLMAGNAYSYSATMVSPEPKEYVDLGLSVKWATCNLGATKPEEYGDYYAWGETETKNNYTISTYRYYKSIEEYVDPVVDKDGFIIESGGNRTFSGYTKYVLKLKAEIAGFKGFYDDNTTLDFEDDVAHVKLGGNWRMPTREEYNELIANCQWQWATYKNVKGCKVTSKKNGYTDRWIFLPAAGLRYNDRIYPGDCYGYYWTPSLSPKYPYAAFALCFSSESEADTDIVNSLNYYRYYGFSIRPVYVGGIEVTGVSLNTKILNLTIGEIYSLSATVTPSNATEKKVNWSSDNTSIATVDQSGTVTAMKAGSTTITVKTTDGKYNATCTVTVTDSALPEVVDLGLSVKWATCNLGASSPEKYGGYFQWAGLEDVTNTSIVLNVSNCPYHIGSNVESGWTKYIPREKSTFWSGVGSPDNKTVLDPEDDIAYVTYGNGWHIPTDAEWIELKNNCSWTWTDDYKGTGIAGQIVTSKKNGYSDKSIFLPAAGYRNLNVLNGAGSDGFYWSSSLGMDYPYYAYEVYFYSDNIGRKSYSRHNGRSIRPVSD